MTPSLMLIFSLTCPATVLENFTHPLDAFDKEEIQIVQKRCPEIYPKSPCVIKLTKVAQQRYKVVCGPRRAK
jgi:hypothetical protein